MKNSLHTHIFLSILILGTFSGAAQAEEFYVDNKADSNCSDVGPGSLSEPFCTIHRSVEAVGPGGTVFIRSGTYNETGDAIGGGAYAGSLTITKSGTPGNPITFKGYPGDPMPVLDGSVAGVPYKSVPVYPNGQSYITVDGLELTKGYMGVWFQKAHHLTIRNCYIHDIQGVRNNNNFAAIGMFFNNNGDATDILIENNTIHTYRDGSGPGSIQSSAILIYSCNRCVMRNNDISNKVFPGTNGISLKGSHIDPEGTGWNGMMEDISIYGNVIHDVVVGVRILARPTIHDVMIYDNLIYNFGSGGIFIWDHRYEEGVVSENVKVFHNTLDARSLSGGFTDSSVSNSHHVLNNIFFDSIDGLCAPSPAGGSGYYRKAFNRYIKATGVTPVDFQEDHNLIYTPGDNEESVLFCWDEPMTLAGWRDYWLARGIANGKNSISVDPQFSDRANDTYTLLYGSPAIDAGRHIAGFHCPEKYDTDPNQTGCKHWTGDAPDIGAYEYGLEHLGPTNISPAGQDSSSGGMIASGGCVMRTNSAAGQASGILALLVGALLLGFRRRSR